MSIVLSNTVKPKQIELILHIMSMYVGGWLVRHVSQLHERMSFYFILLQTYSSIPIMKTYRDEDEDAWSSYDRVCISYRFEAETNNIFEKRNRSSSPKCAMHRNISHRLKQSLQFRVACQETGQQYQKCFKKTIWQCVQSVLGSSCKIPPMVSCILKCFISPFYS